MTLLNKVGAVFLKWLRYGSDDYAGRQKKRIIMTNVMVTATAILSYLHAIFFALYDYESLISTAIMLVVIGTLLLFTPALNRINPYLGSTFNLAIWFFYGSSLVMIFGSSSGVHFYFLAGAASAILIMGIYQNILSMLSIMAQITLFIYFDLVTIPPAPFLDLPPRFFLALNLAEILLSMLFIFCMVFWAFYQAHLAELALQREYEYSERLLANMLPSSIASQLKRAPDRTIANSHDNVTILFADIVEFTPRAQSQSASETVRFLNDLFTRFDRLAQKHGLEKIKTIGDAFMVAGGMPDPQPDHVQRMALMALDMQAEARNYAQAKGDTLELRIGIHTGPAVAGVIGTQKPFYDVWGDTVNTAARLETYGIDGQIQVTADTKALLDDTFIFVRRGKVDIKGKGPLDLWFLSGKK